MANLKAMMFNRKATSSKSKSDQVIKMLSLKPGQQVADIGIGGGYFSIIFSRYVGEAGTVYSVDNDNGLLDNLIHESEKQGLHNIVTVHADGDDFPVKDEELDLVFLRNVYHHLPERVNYFRTMTTTLKTDAKVVIIDYDGKGGLSFHRLFGHSVPKNEIIEEMNAAGYSLVEEHSFLPEQSFLIFTPLKG